MFDMHNDSIATYLSDVFGNNWSYWRGNYIKGDCVTVWFIDVSDTMVRPEFVFHKVVTIAGKIPFNVPIRPLPAINVSDIQIRSL